MFTPSILRPVASPASTCAPSSTTIAASSPISTASGAGSGVWVSPILLSTVSSAKTSWLLRSSPLSRFDLAYRVAARVLDRAFQARRRGPGGTGQACPAGGRGASGGVERGGHALDHLGEDGPGGGEVEPEASFAGRAEGGAVHDRDAGALGHQIAGRARQIHRGAVEPGEI